LNSRRKYVFGTDDDETLTLSVIHGIPHPILGKINQIQRKALFGSYLGLAKAKRFFLFVKSYEETVFLCNLFLLF
jgi:hypothetical protein